jgi:hypothetical protein
MDPKDLMHYAREPGDPHRRALVEQGARDDAAVPVARDWLRRWRPRRIVLSPPACECAVGRCAVCN